MRIRCVCREDGWIGPWVQTPGETLQAWSGHLADTHPDHFQDPAKYNKLRKDEFDYTDGEPPPN